MESDNNIVNKDSWCSLEFWIEPIEWVDFMFCWDGLDLVQLVWVSFGLVWFGFG